MFEDQEDSLDTLEKSTSIAKAVQGSMKSGKAVSKAAKGASVGRLYGALAGTLWENRNAVKKLILLLIVFIMIPILFIMMLPSIIFDGLTATPEIPIMNNDAAIIENMRSAETAVWSILTENHNAILDKIQSEINNLEENEKGIIDDDYTMGSLNSSLLLSQYSASKNYEEINIDDFIQTVSDYQEQLFSYTVSSAESENEEGETITTYTYTIHYIGDNFFTDTIFDLNEEGQELSVNYAQNLMLYLYGTGYSMGGGAQVSDEVLQYADLIEKYAEQYGISEYFNLICAVMMAESGGRVPDVMQSSECPYNTKYPNKPNAIDDPEYSIDCGVHYLSDCLKAAGCSSPNDTGRISLALQGYNFGNGYINWAVKNYGGYSEANAIEFSNMMKKKLGWSNYGNPRYVSDVLKYLVPAGGNGDWGSPFIGRNWMVAVSSEFGNRTDPIAGAGNDYHKGLDIAFPKGTPINSVQAGRVLVAADTNNGYGLHVKIDHGNGMVTLYGHCSKLLVSKGDNVMKGQVIAEVGATGQVTGPHLHIEFIQNGIKKNPREFLPTH